MATEAKRFEALMANRALQIATNLLAEGIDDADELIRLLTAELETHIDKGDIKTRQQFNDAIAFAKFSHTVEDTIGLVKADLRMSRKSVDEYLIAALGSMQAGNAEKSYMISPIEAQRIEGRVNRQKKFSKE